MQFIRQPSVAFAVKAEAALLNILIAALHGLLAFMFVNNGIAGFDEVIIRINKNVEATQESILQY